MNTKNNQRSRETRERVESAFLALLAQKNISQITVREVCERAHITRTAFYGHYRDIYDLLQQVESKMSLRVAAFFKDEATGETRISKKGFLDLFRFINMNRSFYLYFFKNTDAKQAVLLRHVAGYSGGAGGTRETKYRMSFFVGGLNAMIKQWLVGGCAETPEEMVNLLLAEYGIR